MQTINTVTIGGTAMTLQYPFHSLCRIEEEHGVNVFDPETWKPSPRFAAIIIWGGLIHAKPALTLAEVTSGIDIKKFKEVNRTAMDALLEALPKSEKEKTDASAPAKS